MLKRIPVQYFTNDGVPKTPGCPHTNCRQVHPSDSRWHSAPPYEDEIAQKVRQENLDKDDAIKAKLAPVLPPGKLFVGKLHSVTGVFVSLF